MKLTSGKEVTLTTDYEAKGTEGPHRLQVRCLALCQAAARKLQPGVPAQEKGNDSCAAGALPHHLSGLVRHTVGRQRPCHLLSSSRLPRTRGLATPRQHRMLALVRAADEAGV